jgi:hypothetical protein
MTDVPGAFDFVLRWGLAGLFSVSVALMAATLLLRPPERPPDGAEDWYDRLISGMFASWGWTVALFWAFVFWRIVR